MTRAPFPKFTIGFTGAAGDPLSCGAYGERILELPLDLHTKKWVRFEAWDVAANGVVSQPVWLE